MKKNTLVAMGLMITCILAGADTLHAQGFVDQQAVESLRNGTWADGLSQEVRNMGKPEWRPMLAYVVKLHEASLHPAAPPFAYPWEDMGRGYLIGPAIGNWDLVHEIFDVQTMSPEFGREQLLNYLGLQHPSGYIPAAYWKQEHREWYPYNQTSPPVWVVAADEYLQAEAREHTGTYDKELVARFLKSLELEVGWFERNRRAAPDGFLYTDVVTGEWESGVDQGIRWDGTGPGHVPKMTACVDATSLVYQMYVYEAKWRKILGRDAKTPAVKARHLRHFIQEHLWSERDGFFYDSWVLDHSPDGPKETWKGTIAADRPHAFEGMWPVVVGAATDEQARRVVKEWLLNKERFFTVHPIASVAKDDPRFGDRMWRGPSWNATTYWAARGAMRYGLREDAHTLLGAALDDSAKQFDRTGTIWEFYSANGDKPEDLKRKPFRNYPYNDYLGLNPLIAMARLWETSGTGK